MNLEDKLQEFSKWTQELATSRKEELERELEKEFNEICSTFVKNYKKEESKRYEKAFKESEKKHKESITTFNKKANTELFELRENLLNSLFEEIAKDLDEFSAKDAYKEYLTENIKTHMELGIGEIVKISLYEKDMVHKELIEKTVNSENLQIEQIKALSTTAVGGYMVYFDNNSMLDFTFNAKLNDLRRKNTFFTLN